MPMATALPTCSPTFLLLANAKKLWISLPHGKGIHLTTAKERDKGTGSQTEQWVKRPPKKHTEGYTEEMRSSTEVALESSG